MKALTICQPYAHLICLPPEDDRCKRVENRKWSTNYRGALLIHAGKSREWLESGDDYGISESEMTFGAIVAVCKLAAIIEVGFLSPRFVEIPEWALRQHPWLAGHQHVSGPFGWVLTEVLPFEKPVPWKGAQGLFDVPETDELIEQLEACKWVVR